MLRSSILRANAVNVRAITLRNQAALTRLSRQASIGISKRHYADKKSDAIILPGSQSIKTRSEIPQPPILTTPINAAEKLPPPQAVPQLPPKPEEVATIVPTSTVSTTGSTPPPVAPVQETVAPPPPPPPKKPRRFLRLLFNLIVLSSLGYGLGVYYALTSDNWHDFFTEYVPFGEDAVAYFEEREFRKRFLNRPQENTRLHTQVRGEEKITIPGRAGISAKAVDATEVDKPNTTRHISAVEEQKPHPQTIEAQQGAQRGERPAASVQPKTEGSTKVPAAKAPEAKSAPPVEVKHIDNLSIDQASEPVVQDIVKILNDLITVVNADKAGSKYDSSFEKAKGDLGKVITDLKILKDKQTKAADEKVKGLHAEFDKAAQELLRRAEQQMQDMEIRWREEFENERVNLGRNYDQKLDAELASAKRVYDEKVKNELLKQSIALKREFTDSVKDTVERERDGRLSKLDELSSNVAELERLTGEWNKVVDSTMHTQHLLVAVESVRSLLAKSDRPRPFIAELAALKEVASDNAIVNAAIASINPTAYQRGIPTPAQLIDRFRTVASEVRKASLLPDNAGIASHAASLVLSKVMFKKGGLPVGDDVESILGRAEILLEEGNLAEAVREVNSLSGWAKTLSRDWLSECRRVLEVQQALDVIGTEARLRSLLVE